MKVFMVIASLAILGVIAALFYRTHKHSKTDRRQDYS